MPDLRLCRRIDDNHTCGIEVASVEGHNRQIVCQRGRSNEAVLNWHRAPFRAKCREQLGPTQTCRGLPRDAMQPLYSVLEPALQPAPTTTSREQQDAEPDLPQDDRVDGQLGLIAPKPLDNALVWGGLGRLREDVRVNQITRQCDQLQRVG
jgi:hypothetical protein